MKEKYLKNKETVDNFVWRALQIFGKQGTTFFIFFLCARLLSPHDFGIYNYILAAVFLLVMFGDFGISKSVAKYVAECEICDREKLKRVVFNSLLIVFFCSTLVIIPVLIFGNNIFQENYKYILFTLPILFFGPISSLYDGIFRGLKKFKTLSIISLIIGFLSLFLVYFLVSNYGLIGALVAQNIIFFVLSVVLAIVYGNLHFQYDKGLIKEVFGYSVLIGIAGIGYYLYTRIDLVMLGYYDFTIETGYYGLINTLFAFSLIFFTIFGQVIAPDNIKMKIEKRFDSLKRRAKNFSLYSLLFGILISLILFFLVPPVIRTFLPEYNDVEFFRIFYIFLLVIPISVVEATLANGFITPLGYAKILTKTTILGGILNIFFNFLFLYYFGYIGIIFATILVHHLINFLKIFYFWKNFKA